VDTANRSQIVTGSSKHRTREKKGIGFHLREKKEKYGKKI
jgi:hypothetical protein